MVVSHKKLSVSDRLIFNTTILLLLVLLDGAQDLVWVDKDPTVEVTSATTATLQTSTLALLCNSVTA
jgi:hypothetical protein